LETGLRSVNIQLYPTEETRKLHRITSRRIPGNCNLKIGAGLGKFVVTARLMLLTIRSINIIALSRLISRKIILLDKNGVFWVVTP
jgi:hypothetical protein